MTDFFRKQGRSLLANGYLIVPIRPGKKAPATAEWSRSRMGADDLPRFPGHGVGVMTGQGAYPIAAIDIDAMCADLSRRFMRWCLDNLGVTCVRQGLAPKVLLPYRAKDDGWGKATSAVFEDFFGDKQQIEVLGHGQQFVAYHIHPDTGEPYQWLDDRGGIEGVRADQLPVISEEQVCEAIRTFERMAEEMGYTRRTSGSSGSVSVPASRGPREDEDFFGRVNEAALAHMDAWVPVLFPSARATREGGYRVESVDLGRANEEALSLHPSGIKDWGVYDLGDARGGRRTPIDVVLEWWGGLEITSAFEAAQWLCEQLDTKPEDLGFGLRRAREREAATNAKRAALQGVRERIEQAKDSIELNDQVAPVVREVLEQHQGLHSEIEGLFKAKFRELTGTSIAIADVRKVIAPVRVPQPKEDTLHPLTEFGNARRMVDRHVGSIMYVPELTKWYSWQDGYWKPEENEYIQNLAKQTIDALGYDYEKYKDSASDYFAFCKSSQTIHMVTAMVNLSKSDPRVMVPARELDKHTHLIGVHNGVVDLRTGALIPADPEYRITKRAGAKYNPDAKAPWFEQTLREAMFDDVEMCDFIKTLLGYCMMGNPKEDIIVIPWGNGANGKGAIFFNGAFTAFGDYAANADASTFVGDGKGHGNAGGTREDLVRLKGARFVYVGETDQTGVLKEAEVKTLSGGDKITARVPYAKSSVEFMPSWVAVMPTNYKPIIRNDDHGIWRRLVTLPFLRKFDEDTDIKKDPHRKENISKEAEGVLAIIVKGALAYQRNGLVLPNRVKQDRNEYRQQMDLLAEWLDLHCDQGAGHSCPMNELWESWKRFSVENGSFNLIPTSLQLARRLDSRFPSKRLGNGTRVRLGIRLKPQNVPEFGVSSTG